MASRLSGAGYVFLIAFVASVGGFLFGYDLAIIAGANEYLKEQFHLSEGAFGFTTASAALGCMFGPVAGAWLCDRLGRRDALIVASILLAVGSIFTAIPRDIITFNVFRIVGGFGVGICSIGSPMYIAEVAPPGRRGALGFMYQLAIVVGSVLAAVAAYFLASNLPETVSWRWMFASEVLPVAVFVGLLALLPQTPRWLAARGRDDEAFAVLARVEGPDYAARELQEIRDSLSEESGSIAELFAPGMRMALLVGVLLAVFNNYTGWSGIAGYLPTLFKEAGVPDTAGAIFQYALAYGFMGVMTLAACFVVDRSGRRPLWLFGALLMIAANALAGLAYQWSAPGTVVLLAIFLLAIPHSLALGPLPWLMMSEIYPTRIRARAVAITTTILWGAIFTSAWVFPLLASKSEAAFGSVAGVFWFYGAICVAAFFFGWKLLPETKGKTLEQVSAEWRKPALGD